MTKEILVVGGGGHARSVIDVVEAEGRFVIAGVVDNTPPSDDSVLGYSWLGDDTELDGLVARFKYAVVAVGQLPRPDTRIRLFQRLTQLGAELPTIVSPHAVVSAHARLGQGTVVMHGAVVNAGAVVGKNCIVNTMGLIEHDTHVGDHCHISTGARVNGECVVGEESFIGSGAVVFQLVRLPPRSVVSAGSVVRSGSGPSLELDGVE